jgi:hypothetical protein
MPEIEIPFPWDGKSDEDAYSAQNPLTTRSAQNCRVRNPVNGRLQGAQRAGLVQFSTAGVGGGGKVKELCTIIGDNRKRTYAELSPPTAVAVTTPGKVTSRAVRVDELGNGYVMDGNSVLVKYNAQREKLYELPFPVQDPAHIIRALWVDQFFTIFAAVSEGGDQTKCRMWGYEQLNDNEFAQLWEAELTEYVEDLKVVGDTLYTVTNDFTSLKSAIVVYTAIEDDPVLLWEQRDNVAHPVRGMDVSDRGDVYVAIGETAQLTPFPGAPTTQPHVRDIRPEGPTDTPAFLQQTVDSDLPQVIDDSTLITDMTLHAWYDATKQEGADLSGGELENQGRVLIVRDQSGNGRDLFPISGGGGEQAPRWIDRAIGYKPSWSFNGVDEGLVSLESPDTSREGINQQRAVLPGELDVVFHVFIVARPAEEAVVGTILNQVNDNAATSAFSIFSNRDEQDALPGAGLAGEISVFDDTTGTSGTTATGTNDHPVSGAYNTNENNTVLITYTHNNQDGNTNSVLRINGSDTETPYDSDEWDSASPTFIGVRDVSGTLSEYYKGEICEIVVLRGLAADTAAFLTSDDGAEEIEAYLAHKWGIQHNLPFNAGGTAHLGGIDTTTTTGLAGPPPDYRTGAHARMMTAFPITAKYAASNGDLVWALQGDIDASRVGDGFAVKVGIDEAGGLAVYSFGPEKTSSNAISIGSSGSFPGIQKLIDEGDTVSEASGDGAWEVTLTEDAHANIHPRMDVDEFGNLYLPIAESSADSASLNGYDVTGAAGVGVETFSFDLTNSDDGLAVAVDPNIPDYNPDTVDVAEKAWLATDGGSGDDTFHQITFVEVTATTGASRTRTHLAVNFAGDIVEVTPPGTVTTPTGGSSAMDSVADYIQCASAFIKTGSKRTGLSEVAVFVDGVGLPQVYSLRDTAVTALTAKTAGKVPERAKIVEFWRKTRTRSG